MKDKTELCSTDPRCELAVKAVTIIGTWSCLNSAIQEKRFTQEWGEKNTPVGMKKEGVLYCVGGIVLRTDGGKFTPERGKMAVHRRAQNKAVGHSIVTARVPKLSKRE